MKALSERLIKKLKIRAAVVAENETKRNLVPLEPGWPRLAHQAGPFATYIENLLRSGFAPTLHQETLARKPGLGVRPIAYWGPVERVVYRALSEVALGPLEKADRSPEAYVKFMRAPVDRAFELKHVENAGKPDPGQTLIAFSINVPLKYIVKADVSAFYQFVDHEILLDELVNQGGDAEAVASLGKLLREVQGRGFGLPQLLDPSDWLSDIAIDRVERQVHRAGIETWRFNDDFRLGCRTYEESLQAIETLDAAARANGYVLNEHKTLTYSFLNYMMESYDATPETSTDVIAKDDVEVLVGDYTDSFEDDPDEAVSLLAHATPDAGDDGINLKRARVQEVRLLMRALNGLAKAADPRSVDRAPELLSYVPSLTPAVCRYLAVSYSKDAEGVAAALDTIRDLLSLSEWQRVWILDTYRGLNLIESAPASAGEAPRAKWAFDQRSAGRTSVLRATATRALARAKRLTVSQVVADGSSEPSCLRMHYADAALDAAAGTALPQDASALAAFRADSLLNKFACTELPPGAAEDTSATGASEVEGSDQADGADGAGSK